MKDINNTLKLIGSAIGIISGFVGIVSAQGNYRTIGICALLIATSALLFISIYRAIRWKFTSSIGLQSAPRYSIREASVTDLADIAKLQRSFYPHDAVPLRLYEEWFSVNPEGFFVIESKTVSREGFELNELVGHFTFLAIHEDCMKLYLEGEILETHIRHYNLWGPDDRAHMKTIYIESVIIKRAHRRHAMFCLIRMLKTMIANFCDPEIVEKVYAMAATTDGEKTLRGMAFTSTKSAASRERLDGHEMFESDFKQFLSLVIDRETKHEINMLHRAA